MSKPAGGRFKSRPSWAKETSKNIYEPEDDPEDFDKMYPTFHHREGAFDRLDAEIENDTKKRKFRKTTIDDIFDVEAIELDLLKSLHNNNIYLLYQPN